MTNQERIDAALMTAMETHPSESHRVVAMMNALGGKVPPPEAYCERRWDGLNLCLRRWLDRAKSAREQDYGAATSFFHSPHLRELAVHRYKYHKGQEVAYAKVLELMRELSNAWSERQLDKIVYPSEEN